MGLSEIPCSRYVPIMQRWSRKPILSPDGTPRPGAWAVLHYGQPVGEITTTMGGLNAWTCSTTGESGIATLIEDALDLVRACHVLAKVR